MTENASWNTDSDDLPNDIEARFGSDPRKLDTNGDGLLDAKELQATTSPTNRDSGADGIDDRADDVDGDGLSTGGEFDGATDPGDPDSDDDGLDDGAEKKFASSPLACAGWLEVSEQTPLTSDGRPFTAHSPKPPSAPPPERILFGSALARGAFRARTDPCRSPTRAGRSTTTSSVASHQHPARWDSGQPSVQRLGDQVVEQLFLGDDGVRGGHHPVAAPGRWLRCCRGC